MAQHKSTTAFQDAFNAWRDSLATKKKSHKKDFFLFCNTAMTSSASGATPDHIAEAINKIEAENSRKPGARAIRKVLGPVVTILQDYSSILDTLCQADPFPSALIWGSLKVIIEGLGRYFDLFEKIRKEVQLIKFQIERLTWYEELWDDSEDMQRYLCSTYVHLFRFWSAVDKECNRAGFSVLIKATASFSTKKLQSIIEDLKNEVDKVEKLIPILEARNRSGEVQNFEIERQRAGIERAENKEFRERVLKEQEVTDNERLYNNIDSWLNKRANNVGNTRRHQENMDSRFGDTCDWILTTPWFLDWISGTSAPSVVWLHAQPGSGKSTLCSHAIAHTATLPSSPAVVFQFFTFDQECPPRQLLYNIVGQLFDHYWSHKRTVPERLHEANFNTAGDDTEASWVLIRGMMKDIPVLYLFLDGLDEEGISGKQTDVSQITNMVLRLAETFPNQIRVWFSTQDRAKLRNRLQQFAVPDIQAETKLAVDIYLTRALPGLGDLHLDEATQNWALEELKTRATGNFLWATLMVKQIIKSIPSVAHLKTFITNGLPQNLNGYYERMLSRYEDGVQKEYGAKVLSVILFAKRRLTLNEIIDAVSTSGDGNLNQRGDSIFQAFIENLLDPLVEVDMYTGASGSKSCRLFHSTVKTFLLENTTILQDIASLGKKTYPISEDVIALTCLAYLRQTRYSDLLDCTNTEEDEKWLTRDGSDTARHYFLIYSAKYWDKHLNKATQSPALRSEVMEFLSSSNFATTIQVQSLFVERSFEASTSEQGWTWIRSLLPRWLHTISSGKYSSTDLAKYYGIFIYEWIDFLHAPTCPSDLCRAESHAGEIDRCLWGMLGARSFLSKNKGRYHSFVLESAGNIPQESDLSLLQHAPKTIKDNVARIFLRGSEAQNQVLVDGFSLGGSDVSVVCVPEAMLSSTETLEFALENWHIAPSKSPHLKSKTKVQLDAHDCNWLAYIDARRSLNLKRLPVAFYQGLDYLRIGSIILRREENGEYTKFFDTNFIREKYGWYFENAAARGTVIALVRRQKPPKKPKSPGPLPPPKPTNINPENTKPVDKETLSNASEYVLDVTDSKFSAILDKEAAKSRTAQDDSDEDVPPATLDPGSDVDDPYISSSAASDDSVEYDSADESWSDGSTDVDNARFSANDNKSFTSRSSSFVSGTDSNGSSDSEESLSHADIQKTAISFFDLDDNENRANYFGDGDEDGNGYESDVSNFKPKYRSGVPKGLITVFDTSSTPPTQLFQYLHTMPLKLYSSPPVIHPTKSLVVWPLCYGDILFADFKANSYYTRRVRTTTLRSQHVFTRLRFSDDGKYLHIASLEAQKQTSPSIPKEQRQENQSKKKRKLKISLIKISLFVTTNRLSERKTSRSPPTLVFRVKASLGSYASISASHTPLSLTWTSNNLYCMVGGEKPLLLRIALFDRPAQIQPTLESESNVEQQNRQPFTAIHSPKEVIMLPTSSRVREIKYFPPSPSSPSSKGLMMLGSFNRAVYRHVKEMFTSSDKKDKDSVIRYQDDTLMQALPPSGVWLHETDDLGGWIETDRVVELKDQNVRLGGRLDRKIERWDMEEDECICQNPIII